LGGRVFGKERQIELRLERKRVACMVATHILSKKHKYLACLLAAQTSSKAQTHLFTFSPLHPFFLSKKQVGNLFNKQIQIAFFRVIYDYSLLSLN
jgi:hypothetical protein